jgi:transcriptional regulator with XRE-family HTH domain
MLHHVQLENINAAIGANVATLRNERGWSQAELAERWGAALGRRVDPTTVTRLERGRRPIPAHELVVLAEVLGAERWTDLVNSPVIREATAVVDRQFGKAEDAYTRILQATDDYLRALYLLSRLIPVAEERGATLHASVRELLEIPPERAVIAARVRQQLERKREIDRDELGLLAEEDQILDILRSRNLVEDFNPDSIGADHSNVEH